MFEHDHHRHDAHGARPLGRAVWFTLGFAIVEAVVGWWGGSLALLADSGHMLTDSVSLLTAFGAAQLAQRPADRRYTYGYGRVEVLTAALNALFMFGIVAAIAWSAFERLASPVHVHGLAVMLVALLGMVVNVMVFLTLRGGTQTINVRGALLHVLGDLLGSVAAVVAGAVVWLTGWTPIDPLLSLVVCGLLLASAARLLRESLDVMLERVPRDIDVAEVGSSMAGVDGVLGVHDLHIWTASSDIVALSAHVEVELLADWERVLPALKHHLSEVHGIEHVTLQPEPRAQPLRRMARP